MSVFNPRRFVDADVLRRVSPANLLRLLTSTAGAYLAQPAPDGLPRVDLAQTPLDFDRLVKVLVQADDADYPDDLADALFHLATFADSDAVCELLDAFKPVLLLAALAPDPSAADVALHAWLLDSALVERVLGERNLYRSKNFVSYMGPSLTGTPLGTIAPAKLTALQVALADWFLKNRGSDFVRVLVYPMGTSTWFLVHHAKAAERRGVIKKGVVTSSVDRPDRYDLVTYSPDRDELSLNTENDKEMELYRTEFGKHIFNAPAYFVKDGKYTLEPLIAKGALSMTNAGVAGVDKVTLKEAQFGWGGQHEIEIRRADDLFAAYAARTPPRGLPKEPFRATLLVKLSAVKRPRTVVIRKPNIARYQHDGERDIIEEWLVKQGFIK